MQSLNDDERKEMLGELKTIREYLKEIPALQEELLQNYATVNDISNRLNMLEHVARGHEPEIKRSQRGVA